MEEVKDIFELGLRQAIVEFGKRHREKYWLLTGVNKEQDNSVIYYAALLDVKLRGNTPLKTILTEQHESIIIQIKERNTEIYKELITTILELY